MTWFESTEEIEAWLIDRTKEVNLPFSCLIQGRQVTLHKRITAVTKPADAWDWMFVISTTRVEEGYEF